MLRIILSRMLVRVAVLAASLAWGGFVFTQTVGDPGRGEEIARAVLDDDAARAEVVAPITDSVMQTTGLPPDQQPVVAAQVDQLLQDPQGVQAFVDPFAGSWSRMLGEDDPRPTDFDLAPLMDEIAQIAGTAGDAIAQSPLPTRLPVGDVPLPRASIGWMDGVRNTISIAVGPLAILAAALFVIAFLIGERARVLRRFGVWAISAGLMWVVVPPLLVWAATRWAPGADSVVAAALDAATSGLLGVALLLVVGGVAAFVVSYVPAVAMSGLVVGGDGSRGQRSRPDRYRDDPVAGGYDNAGATTQVRRLEPVRGEAMDVLVRESTGERARRRTITRDIPVTPPVEPPVGVDATPVAGTPTVDRPAPRQQPRRPQQPPDDDGDSLWDFYSSS